MPRTNCALVDRSVQFKFVFKLYKIVFIAMGAAYSAIGFIKLENDKVFDIEDDDTVRFSGEY